jgi:serine/threonine protein phosphatase PrpC
MPFQLACPGPDQYSDTCESATVYELELEPGDVVLLATDGVLDNMWDEQIAHVIHKCLRVSKAPLLMHIHSRRRRRI